MSDQTDSYKCSIGDIDCTCSVYDIEQYGEPCDNCQVRSYWREQMYSILLYIKRRGNDDSDDDDSDDDDK